MPRICVHAGFHKTATTSFQAYCTQNRAALRRHGLHYARLDYQQVLDRPNHSFVFRSAYDAAAAGDNRLRQSLVRELGRQLQGCDSMLISGEVISVLSDPAKALLLQDLRLLADELRFFLLVRHPKSYFQSALQEHLRVWAGINVFSLPENMLAGLVDHEWGSLYTRRLAFFRAHLADHELIVRKYEDACAAPDGVIGYLLRDCLGLQHPPGLHMSPRSANASLAHESLLIICALKSLRTVANNTVTNRMIGMISQAALRGGCRQAFAATLAHCLPPISTELAWLEANFGLHYDPEAFAFEPPDPAKLWSAQFIDSLLGFAVRQPDLPERLQLAAALEFLSCRPETQPGHAAALAAASRRLQSVT
jgi:hypothetical protein